MNARIPLPSDGTTGTAEMVDVGGYSLHINCVGRGSPTVILDGGRACAPTTVRGWDGANGDPNPGMPDGSPANSTPCSRVPASMALTYWWGIRSAACTCKPTPPGIL